jgi:hypothetical protein
MKGSIAVALFTSLVLASSASASPYPLTEILKKEAAAKLAKQKVTTSDELLEKAAKAKDRQALAKATGFKPYQLLVWARMCDLLRIKGVGPEMVRLFKAGRILMVKQLRAQKAGPLHKRLMGVNKKKKITQNPPTEEQLETWIGEAKKLKLVLR